MSVKKDQTQIGILGGGQLARMLCLKAHEAGWEPHVLSPSPEDPAAQVTAFWHKGFIDNRTDLSHFFKNVDIVTFESEFCDVSVIQSVARENKKVTVAPSLQAIGILQDRLSQKESLIKCGLPTSRFFEVSSYQDLQKLYSQFPKGCVLKRRRFGYDGYGTFVLKSKKDLQKLNPDVFELPGGFIVEEHIPFKRELAIMGFRNASGDLVTFPLSETYQENARCLWVKGPISHNKAFFLKKKLKKYMESLNYVGAMALELFDTGNDLIVNEVAPRVHNSGHYSLDGLTIDQFALHLRSIVGIPLKTPKLLQGGYAMYNLLGQSKKAPKLSFSSEAHLHWYGKKENRPGRKMGHINHVSSDPDKSLKILKKSAKEFQL